MKRVLGILAGACLALAIGCAQSYDIRVEKAIESLKYKQALEKNTEEPPATSNLKNVQIFIRSPKGIKGPAKTFVYEVEPGKYDIADSFIDTEQQVSLHLLARTNTPKQAASKKAAAPAKPGEEPEPAAPTAARGEFTPDVLDFVKATYSTDVDASKLKTISPTSFAGKSVTYKGTTIDSGDKEVQVYFYGDKNGPAQVALIFEGPKDTLHKMSTQLNYSLNSLRVGASAASLYNGQDEFGGGEEAAPPPSGVF